MRIMIPLVEGKLTPHFGHCSEFAQLDVDESTGEIKANERIDAPPHQPGLLPGWLAERDANLVIVGGMGQRARDLLEERGVTVIVGVAPDTPEALVERWHAGSLAGGQNLCDH